MGLHNFSRLSAVRTFENKESGHSDTRFARLVRRELEGPVREVRRVGPFYQASGRWKFGPCLNWWFLDHHFRK